MTSAAQPARHPPIPHGAVAVRMHLFGSPRTEVLHALLPPWPRWVVRLYELEEAADERIDPERAEVTLGAALAATADRIKHHLDLLAWAATALESLGWRCELHGDSIVAWKVTPRVAALDELDEAGIEGPLCAICELGEGGHPRLFDGWEL